MADKIEPIEVKKTFKYPFDGITDGKYIYHLGEPENGLPCEVLAGQVRFLKHTSKLLPAYTVTDESGKSRNYPGNSHDDHKHTQPIAGLSKKSSFTAV